MISANSYAAYALRSHLITVSLIESIERSNRTTAETSKEESIEILVRETSRRCYYAGFLLARQFAQSHDFQIPNDVGHTELWNWFQDSPVGAREGVDGIAAKGFRSFARRKWADYEIGKSYENRNQMLHAAKQDLKAIASTLAPPLQSVFQRIEAEHEARMIALAEKEGR
jgi:hypothetical protein